MKLCKPIKSNHFLLHSFLVKVTIVTVFAISGCQNIAVKDETQSIWGNAKWIAYEQLEDSMIVIPAVHGSGNELGNKSVKRSVVPMFRKEFTINKVIE